jgi:hypothetical protein
MTKKTYQLRPKPGAAFGLTVYGHFAECNKCKRKILVELPLIGVPHHTDVQVTCADCLVVSDVFKTEYPEEAKQIEEWLTQ